VNDKEASVLQTEQHVFSAPAEFGKGASDERLFEYL
jgi:hypothetical protein